MSVSGDHRTIELLYPANVAASIAAARKQRRGLWAFCWAIGLLFVVWGLVEEPMLCLGAIIWFALPLIIETALRKVEGVALRMNGTRIQIMGNGEIRQLSERGEILATVSKENARVRMSVHAGGHTIYTISGSASSASASTDSGNKIIFTTHLENVEWLIGEFLGAPWPVDEGGG